MLIRAGRVGTGIADPVVRWRREIERGTMAEHKKRKRNIMPKEFLPSRKEKKKLPGIVSMPCNHQTSIKKDRG